MTIRTLCCISLILIGMFTSHSSNAGFVEYCTTVYTGSNGNLTPQNVCWYADDGFSSNEIPTLIDNDGGNLGIIQPITQEEAVAICNSHVDQMVGTCKATYSSYQNGMNGLCGLLAFGTSVTGGVVATFCVSTVTELTRKANNWCETQGAIKKANECNF